MKQVFLSGQGQVELFDAPVPERLSGGVLVQNAFSLISSGTEGAAVTKNAGIRGIYEKAKNSQHRTGQIWNMLQDHGVTTTIATIKNKLGDYNPLGYSCAGVILETDNDLLDFSPGKKVACIGTNFANHAEYVSAPRNLVVSVPDHVGLEQAAFGAIACIAMQGIRRLDLSPGERIAVVGLGLIGQIALRLAVAMGYEAFGLDINPNRVAHAKKHSGARMVLNSNFSNPTDAIQGATASNGVDGVVICASGKDNEIINRAFNLCRQRGRVAVVGDIGLGLERAKMYAKELEVRLSCSYGPGRYDKNYEMDGNDYPLAYARWTEGRNLEYFISLLSSGRLDLSDLVSKRIPISSVKEAYDLIKSADSNIYGVLLDYNLQTPPTLPVNAFKCVYSEEASCHTGDKTVIGLIGAGSYAKATHIPNIQSIPDMVIRGVVSKTGSSAATVAKKVGAAFASSKVDELLSDGLINAVIISTRHSSHAQLVIDALEAKKHVFVEKPMATNVNDCLKIIKAQNKNKCIVRVGFNRRFSPYLQEMKRAIGEGQKLFNIRVNVANASTHWSNTTEEGGRLMGEGVHFTDIANWMMGSYPITLSASCIGHPGTSNPNMNITLSYEDGSVANISYITKGHQGLGKEYYELFGNGISISMRDFKDINSFGTKVGFMKKAKSNKGQLEALKEFSSALRSGRNCNGADPIAGLWATLLIETAIISAKERKFINFKDIELINEFKFSL